MIDAPAPGAAPRRSRGWLAAQLPAAMLDDPTSPDPFVRRFVQIFEDVAETVLDRLDGLEHQLDPAVCSEALVPWLGAWLGVETDGLPATTQRRLVAISGRLLSARGTRRNLAALVTALTGATPRIADSGGVVAPDDRLPPAEPKQVVVELPATGPLSPAQLEAALRREIPADAALVLRLPSGPTSSPAGGLE